MHYYGDLDEFYDHLYYSTIKECASIFQVRLFRPTMQKMTQRKSICLALVAILSYQRANINLLVR